MYQNSHLLFFIVQFMSVIIITYVLLVTLIISIMYILLIIFIFQAWFNVKYLIC